MKRGVVLGGGGIVGIAWESGLLAGLNEKGIRFGDADVFVGTSAGSFVGTQLASGQEFTAESESADKQEASNGDGAADSMSDLQKTLDLEIVGQVFQLWTSVETMTTQVCQQIGELALRAPTMTEEQWVSTTGGGTGLSDWPEKEVRVTTVDVQTGELGVHSKSTNSPIQASVAASCSIPGMFPPITINGVRYMDGGVRSGTNADILAEDGLETVVIIAPICEGTALFGGLAERTMNQEAELLRGNGANVLTIIPGAKEIEAFGPDLMNPARAALARQAGYERGLALAEGEAQSWLG